MLYTEELKTKINSDEFDVLLQEYKRSGSPLAKDRIVVGSQVLIRSIANKYTKQAYSLDVDDLIIEGTIGLYTAIKKYDLSQDVKFTTYATYWIKQAIQRSIYSTDKLIRYPETVEVEITKYNKDANEALINGNLLERDQRQQRLAWLDDNRRHYINLHEINDSDDSIVDIYLKDESVDIENEVIKKVARENFLNLVKKCIDDFSKHRTQNPDLVKKRKDIINYWFGLNNYPKLNLSEIAEMYGDSRQNINQIIKRFTEYISTALDKDILDDYYKQLIL